MSAKKTTKAGDSAGPETAAVERAAEAPATVTTRAPRSGGLYLEGEAEPIERTGPRNKKDGER